MIDIDKIIVHCSFTRPNQDVGAEEIRLWHINRGFNDIGYHYVIRQNGRIDIGRDVRIDGAHTYGQNQNSIGVCLIGGMGWNSEPVNDYSEKQLETLRYTINVLTRFGDNVGVYGHNDFTDKKPCPNFNVKEWYYK